MQNNNLNELHILFRKRKNDLDGNSIPWGTLKCIPLKISGKRDISEEVKHKLLGDVF